MGTRPDAPGPVLIGLTGGIASGKSSVAARLRALGASVWDADVAARRAVAPGGAALGPIVARFGPGIVDDAGRLRRAELGRQVFGDPAALADLNRIVHPHVVRRLERRVAAARRARLPILVLEVPLLFEAGLDRRCDRIWVVAVPAAVQVERLRRRNGLSEAEASARVRSQWPVERRLARADAVIWNDRPWPETERCVDRLWREAVASAVAGGPARGGAPDRG
jgi:dephospho-CoA kinase